MSALKLTPRQTRLIGLLVAVAGPAVLTWALAHLGGAQKRDYVFFYLALVAVLGVLSGLWPSVLAAAISFLLVDWFFVPPVGTWTIADEQDIVNLLAFAATAGVVGVLASQRRRALLKAEALARNLQQSNAELARLNKEQAAAAQAALTMARSQEQIRALQELDRFRKELLANVSHELRTPLSTILAESTSPPGTDEDLASAERRRHVIATEALRLKALVDDMMDLALIEGGTMGLHFEPVLLSDALEAAVERLHERSPDRRVVWDRQPAAVDVLADWDRLLQVLDNLLANADRYSSDGAPVEIGVEPDEAGLVAVRVRDHGPGVAAEVRPRLFERFVHGPAAEGAKPGGTGLGLAIAKALVEAHAGSISLEETDGAGATFRFTLPLAPAQA